VAAICDCVVARGGCGGQRRGCARGDILLLAEIMRALQGWPEATCAGTGAPCMSRRILSVKMRPRIAGRMNSRRVDARNYGNGFRDRGFASDAGIVLSTFRVECPTPASDESDLALLDAPYRFIVFRRATGENEGHRHPGSVAADGYRHHGMGTNQRGQLFSQSGGPFDSFNCAVPLGGRVPAAPEARRSASLLAGPRCR
jgi:hypothetical protein